MKRLEATLRTLPVIGATATVIASARHLAMLRAAGIATLATAVVLLGYTAVQRARGRPTNPASVADTIIGVGALVLGVGVLIASDVGGTLVVVIGLVVIGWLIVYAWRKGKQASGAAL